MSIELKSQAEIEILKEGGKRHAQILSDLSALVKPGVSTFFLEQEARRMIEAMGDKSAFLGYKPRGARRPFPAALCVSINNEIVHGIPNEVERLLNEGDLVSLDLGLVHEGLITDSAVTVSCGAVDDEARELLRVGKEALQRGIEAAQGGNYVGDIGAAIDAVVSKSNFSSVTDLAGHGVGYKVHEEPFVPNVGKAGAGEKLVPGMVIAIEPMVNAGTPEIKLLKDGYTFVTRDGERSVHFEHTIAITEKGPIILTSND